MIGILKKKKKKSRDLRDDSKVKSASCSSGGPRMNSQYPHAISQLSVTPFQGFNTLMNTHYRQNTNAHKMEKKTLKKKEERTHVRQKTSSIYLWVYE